MRLALALALSVVPLEAGALELFRSADGAPMTRRELVLTGAASLAGGLFFAGIGLHYVRNPASGESPLAGEISPALPITFFVVSAPLFVLAGAYFLKASETPPAREPDFFARDLAWRLDRATARAAP